MIFFGQKWHLKAIMAKSEENRLWKGFKKEKKGVEFSITLEAPPPKVMKYIFYLFYIWVLKSILIQRIFKKKILDNWKNSDVPTPIFWDTYPQM